MNGCSGLEGGKWREASVRRLVGWSRRGSGWQVERTRWIQDLLEVEATDLGDGMEMKMNGNEGQGGVMWERKGSQPKSS